MEVVGDISNRSINNKKKPESKAAGLFFMATLLLWGFSVGFEIVLNKRTELLAVAAGFIFFQTANWILRCWVSSDPILVNTSVSLLHSSLTSSAVVLIMVKQWVGNPKNRLKMLEHKELVEQTWEGAYTALCFTSGYFGYDQWDMLKKKMYSGGFPSILAHHLILLICFTLALFRNVTINYLILTLICELHSVFLHVRKIRRMGGIRKGNTAMVKAEWLLNGITFIAARLIPHALILLKLVKDVSHFEDGIQFPLACFGMIAMNMLNIGLAIDLLRAYNREMNITPHTH